MGIRGHALYDLRGPLFEGAEPLDPDLDLNLPLTSYNFSYPIYAYMYGYTYIYLDLAVTSYKNTFIRGPVFGPLGSLGEPGFSA